MTIDIGLILLVIAFVLAAIGLLQSEGKSIVGWAVLFTDIYLLYQRLK